VTKKEKRKSFQLSQRVPDDMINQKGCRLDIVALKRGALNTLLVLIGI
jgi:hypothetical protein